jgi:hypothetical protein
MARPEGVCEYGKIILQLTLGEEAMEGAGLLPINRFIITYVNLELLLLGVKVAYTKEYFVLREQERGKLLMYTTIVIIFLLIHILKNFQ